MKIRLTQYESGLPVDIEPDFMAAVTRLNAYQCNVTGFEGGSRTRIDGKNGMMWLVQETPDQIRTLIKEQECSV